MSKMDFVNDMKDNFWRMKYNEEDIFEINMLTENRIRYFLPVEKRNINGEKYLYYTITGRQALENLLTEKCIDQKWFDIIIQSIEGAISSAESFFLFAEGICLLPDKMFWNYEEHIVEFAYCPGESDRSIRWTSLGEFFVERMDYNDAVVVETIQRFYEQVLNNSVSIETFLTKKEDIPYSIEAPIKPSEMEYVEEQFTEQVIEEHRENGKQTAWRSMAILSVGIFILTMIATVIWKKIFFPGIVLLLVSLLGSLLVKKKTEKEEMIPTDSGKDIEDDIEHSVEDVTLKSHSIAENTKTVYMEVEQMAKQKLYGTKTFRKYKFELSKLPCTLGKDADLVSHVVEDVSVSRMHAKFYEEDGALWMQDLNSTNGTFQNGIKLYPNQKVQLETEDELVFGRASFIYL